MFGTQQDGFFKDTGGGGSASIDIDINGATFLEDQTTNVDIEVLNENDDPLGADDLGVWRVANIDLTQPNGDIESEFAGVNLSCTQIASLLTADLIAQLTDAQVAAVYDGRVSLSVVEYTSNDTYTKPSNLMWAYVFCLGGGGGGGSGRRGAAGSNRFGGGGGGGGALTWRLLQSSAISSSESVAVGSGGAGGVAVSADSNNGMNGDAGGSSALGLLVVAEGGEGGYGGAVGTGLTAVGGSVFNCTPDAIPNALSGMNGTPGRTSVPVNAASTGFFSTASGGGAGAGGVTSAGALGNGGSGSQGYDETGALNTAATAGTAPGGNGGDGIDNWSMQLGFEFPVIPTNTVGAGSSGAGGAGSESTTGGAGGSGGLYGSGGGGGGATLNGFNSGAGGSGAQGFVVVVEYLAT